MANMFPDIDNVIVNAEGVVETVPRSDHVISVPSFKSNANRIGNSGRKRKVPACILLLLVLLLLLLLLLLVMLVVLVMLLMMLLLLMLMLMPMLMMLALALLVLPDAF